MSRVIKRVMYILGGLTLLLAVMAAALIIFVNPDDYKSQLQTTASEVLGMEVDIGGGLGIGFYPGLRLTAADVQIANQGKGLVVVKKLRVGLELIPLLRDKVRITDVSLIRPRVTIERSANGRYNFDREQTVQASLPPVELPRITIVDGALSYLDRGSDARMELAGCDLKLRDLRLGGGDMDVMKGLFLKAGLSCEKIRINEYRASNLRLAFEVKNGLFHIKPISMNVFGGTGTGDILADYSSQVANYRVRLALPGLRIEEVLKAQSSKMVLEGPMDFTMNLTMQGNGSRQVQQSAHGDVVLQGNNLKLHGHDLDLELDRYESSQNFSLLDMGALFVAGPVGMAVTKGRDFAGVLQGSDGVGAIGTFVSRWKVRRGVMHAQDVAMATKRHRMALLGGLDMVNGRFVDVTLALIDHQGCAEVQQKISGPFENPSVQQPSIIKSVAGPVLKLLEKGRKLLPGSGCRVIYSGSVAPPR